MDILERAPHPGLEPAPALPHAPTHPADGIDAMLRGWNARPSAWDWLSRRIRTVYPK